VEITESTSAAAGLRRPCEVDGSIYASMVSKLRDEFTIALPVNKGSFACLDAIATLGWNLKAVEPDRIITKIGVGVTRNPSKIEVLLSETGDQTAVRLNGSIVGIGPVQKGHLKAEMLRLREVIERCAQDAGAH
jgi:hypothetical protein